MAVRYGKYLTGVLSGTKDKLAPGYASNAAMRRNREVIALDDGGAAAIDTNIGIGVLRGGDCLDYVEISAAVASLAGVSFSVGNATQKTKYSGAIAGPAAGASVRIKIIDANDSPGSEELFLWTTVGALPTTANARLQVDTYFSHK